MRVVFRYFLGLAAVAIATASPAAPVLSEALALFQSARYPEARDALEQIVAAEPGNAIACQYLGLTIAKHNSPDALDRSLPWLEKARALAPDNPDILGDYGGTCLLLAEKHWSIHYAREGRAAMERCLALNPDDLDAREGLMRYFAEAPWPFGSAAKAKFHAAEISRRDFQRGLMAAIYLKGRDDAPDEIMALCEESLRSHPDSYVALFELGRAASLARKNIERGIEALTRCLALPAPASFPGKTRVHYRLGVLQELRGDRDAARESYRAALALDPANADAGAALARLK